MCSIDEKKLSTAFVDETTPSLAEILERVGAAPDLTPTRRRDLASGLRRLAKAIGLPLEEIPADMAWLRPRIGRVVPAALGISPKSWANTVSDARAALVLCGVADRRQAATVRLADDWQELWNLVSASGDKSLELGLGRFVRFLSRLGIRPEEVGDEHSAAFEQALVLNEIRKCPGRARKTAIRAWNRTSESIAGWPRQKLTLPPNEKRYGLPLEYFPDSFSDDLARYLEGMRHPDPLDPETRLAPLREATIANRRANLIRFASAIAHSGMALDELTDLSVLVANARQGLSWLIDRNGGTSSAGIADQAITLAQVARHHVRPAQTVQNELDRWVRKLTLPRAPGLTEKNRERLRPLLDPETLGALIRLPARLEEAARSATNPCDAAMQMETAVAIKILLTAPIRRKNLVELHLEHNLRRMRDGRTCLVYEAAEVKNRRPLEVELPKATVGLIDRHLAHHRPHLVPAGSPFLFPRRTGPVAILPDRS